MAQGTAETRAYTEGKRKGCRVTLPESIDMLGIRSLLHLSQHPLCGCFRLVCGRGAPLGVGPSKSGGGGVGAFHGDRSRSVACNASDQGREGFIKDDRAK